MKKILARLPFQSAPPAVLALPTVYGTAQVGQTLTASTGSWANNPASFAYQWQNEGSPIRGATSSTYSPVASDLSAIITVKVTATNSTGASLPAIGFLAGLIKVMPIGDSITFGTDGNPPHLGIPGGYRGPLWTALQNDGYNIQFVGSQTTNPGTGLPSVAANHAGYGGATTRCPGLAGQLTNCINGYVDQTAPTSILTANPDVILLLIGVNDFFRSSGTTTAQKIADYSALIDDILGKLPAVKIICSNLVQQNNLQSTFNPDLATMLATKGPRVSLADLHSLLTSADIGSDATHPLASGYTKMAAGWKTAFEAVVPLTLGPVISATAVYVSNSIGSDSYDGTAPTPSIPVGTVGPYKTIAKVNTLTPAAGTSILFRRGDRWDRSGGPTVNGTFFPIGAGSAIGGPIVYDAYGIGANPIIDGSADASTTAAWQLTATANVWESVKVFAPTGGAGTNGHPYFNANDVGNILWGFSPLGGSAPAAVNNASFGTMRGTQTGTGLVAPFIWYAPGEKQTALANTSTGTWNFNTDTNRAQVYVAPSGGTPVNPATAMPGLRLVLDGGGIVLESTNSYMTFQNLTFQHIGASSAFVMRATHTIVRDCVFQWIGGGNIGGTSTYGSRAGDGMNPEYSYDTIMVERNYFYQMYDVGISPQLAHAGAHDNLTIRNNVFHHVGEPIGIGLFPNQSGSTQNGLNIYNNTSYVVSSWSANQRPNGFPAVWGLALAYDATIATTNTNIENNVFAGIGGTGGNFGVINQIPPSFSLASMAPIVWDHNDWSLASGLPGILFGVATLPNYTMAQWKANFNPFPAAPAVPLNPLGLGAHDLIDIDPAFTNQSAANLTPATGSPLLNAGANLTSVGVVWDFNHKPRPSSGAFTMGAYQ